MPYAVTAAPNYDLPQHGTLNVARSCTSVCDMSHLQSASVVAS